MPKQAEVLKDRTSAPEEGTIMGMGIMVTREKSEVHTASVPLPYTGFVKLTLGGVSRGVVRERGSAASIWLQHRFAGGA